jgi:uncharacterized LabA/DUF88 family protein
MPAPQQDHISMALFCDFENVALGVRDAQYDKFDIKRVLERLLLKGSIVVKKAYCDWDRYRQFKGTMHEANFELIEIPHVRQSGKNSADIRLVVDALDLCYTKSHVNTFVIISGDSDFSPLVSKLRENAKYVIGVGVKQSTSDLLIANCDEFIFYDDLVRESQRNAARRDQRDNANSQPPQPRRSPEEERRRREELDARRTKIVELAAETYEALVTDRDEGGRIWASVLKEALKRRNPGFNESYYGFRTFGNLLEEAQSRGLLEFGRDEKSGTFVFRGSGVPTQLPQPTAPVQQARPEGAAQAPAPHTPTAQPQTRAPAEQRPGDEAATEKPESSRRRGGRGRNRSSGKPESNVQQAPNAQAPVPAPADIDEPVESWYEPVEPEEMTVPVLTSSAPPIPAIEQDEAQPALPDGDGAQDKPARARRPRQAAGKSAKKTATDASGDGAAKPARKAAAKRAPKAPKGKDAA